MPRARRAATPTVPTLDGDEPIAGLENLGQDPAPRPARTRKAPAARTGNRGKIPVRTASGRMMSKQQMVDKVSAEVYTYLSLAAAGWQLAEERSAERAGVVLESTCADVMFERTTVPTPDGPRAVERLEGISERLVAILARNDKALAAVAKSGIVGELAVLAHLVFPIVRVVWSNHGPTGDGHGTRVMEDPDALADRYPAFQPA